MAESVAELFGLLGIKTDFESVAKAQSALNRVKESADKATATHKLSAALFHAHGNQAANVAKSMGFAYDAAVEKATEATVAAEKYGGVMVALNQTLQFGITLYRGIANGVRAVVGAVEAVSNQASQAVDMAKELGIDAEGVQELGYAASQSSSNLEQLSGGLGKLSKNVAMAKLGSKQAAGALREVGVDVKDLTSGHEKLDGALESIADKFQKMPDGAKKSALAMRLFGLSGRAMIPLLNEGAAGIKRLRQEAEDAGFVIDNKAAAGLENFGDDTDKLKASLIGLRNQAIAALLPVLSRMVNGLQQWVQAHRQLLVGALTTALRGFLGVLEVVGKVVQGVAAVAKVLADNWEFVIGAVVALTVALGPLIAATLIYGAIAVATAAIAAAAWLAAAAPALLVAAGITLLVGLIIRFRKSFASALSAVGGFFRALFGGIRDGAAGAWHILEAMGSAIGGFFGGIASTIRSVFDAVVNFFIDRVNDVLWVVNKAITALNYLPGVDINHVGKVEHIGGGKKTATVAATASIPLRAGAGAGTVDNSTMNQTNHVVINAQGMDEAKLAKAIAAAADDRLRSAKAKLK